MHALIGWGKKCFSQKIKTITWKFVADKFPHNYLIKAIKDIYYVLILCYRLRKLGKHSKKFKNTRLSAEKWISNFSHDLPTSVCVLSLT